MKTQPNGMPKEIGFATLTTKKYIEAAQVIYTILGVLRQTTSMTFNQEKNICLRLGELYHLRFIVDLDRKIALFIDDQAPEEEIQEAIDLQVKVLDARDKGESSQFN